MIKQTAVIIPFGGNTKKTEAVLDLVGSDNETTGPVSEKLQDALTPGYQAEFDPAEAEAAGAFEEDALSEADALASSHDTLHFAARTNSVKE
jgi:hypothetical protein